jgi:hypothetical protein
VPGSSTENVSYRLLQTGQPPAPGEIVLFEEVMRQMQLSSGIFRTTARGRFRNLDPQVIDLLASHFGTDSPIQLEDWGASSCLTSAEWALALWKRMPPARLVASDLLLFLVEAVLPSGEAYVFEPGGAALQWISGRFVVRLFPPPPRRFPVNRVLAGRARRRFEQLRANWNLPADWLGEDCLRPQRAEYAIGTVRFRRIPILHPEVVELAMAENTAEKRFAVRVHSAFDALPAPVHVIRSMNLFNRSYFSDERLRQGTQAVWRSLVPGGIWIVGRTLGEQDYGGGSHQVSVLAKTEHGFRLLERLSSDGRVGSEIEELAVGWRC